MRGIFATGLAVSLICFLLLPAADYVLGQELPTAEPPAVETKQPAMPRADRLAPPPTVIPATQADDGEQLFWVWCQPCHGDMGQGLTDEWREQYPEDHQNCWEAGCHGDRPYENGFTLPQHVPAIIGDQTLLRFQTMEELFDYVHTRMPFENPGALSEEEALAVTAFLVRSHGKWDGTPLTKENVSQFRLQPLSIATPQVNSEARFEEGMQQQESPKALPIAEVILVASIVLVSLAVLGTFVLWRRRI
jgi:mono/diheme cytochrome c family protein